MDALETNGGPADIAEIEQIVKEKMVRFILMLKACSVRYAWFHVLLIL